MHHFNLASSCLLLFPALELFAECVAEEISALRKRKGVKLTLQRMKLRISIPVCLVVLVESEGAGLRVYEGNRKHH